ncbi:mobilisation protein (MobC) [Pilibacter termitis]|uniref:Mobilisation protein (MobC) n=1 Tax=Pilibacter termitis TaxID=263852 RepID=A0A1T4KTF3_9ENTE|nr:plasmid mobilization relaxosome protein MobC [Pilibacter termitis]SJZ45709.1 mobilisation protein (MobC) [Pilibacter termitis]
MQNPEKRKRPLQKKIRFSPEEIMYINKKIKESPYKNFQNFARIMLLTGEVKFINYSELETLNYEVNRIGNNINQMAKLAHQFEEIAEEDILKLRLQLEEVEQMIRERFNQEIKTERRRR